MTDAVAVMALLPAVLPVWRIVLVPEAVFLLVEFLGMVFLLVEFLEVVFLLVVSELMREQGGRSRRSWHIHLCRNLQENFARKTVP